MQGLGGCHPWQTSQEVITGLEWAQGAYGRQGACPARDLGDQQIQLPLQVGMPQTLSVSDMVTPGSLCPPPTELTDGQAGQPPWVELRLQPPWTP